MERFFSWIERLNEISESYKGLFVISLTLTAGYAIYSYLKPTGIHSPGIYIFGAITPILISIYLIFYKKNAAAAIGLFVFSITTVVIDSVLRLNFL